MHFDDARADRLEIDDAAVALEVLAAPRRDPVLDRGVRLACDLPIVEGALVGGDAAGVTPPFRVAVNYHHITADMVALQQGRPEMAGSIRGVVVSVRAQRLAAHAHALEVVDGLGKDRIMRRANAVRRRLEALAQRHGELVVDPAMIGIPQPRVAVLSRNEDVFGAGYPHEILGAPGIDFANRHVLFLLRYGDDANISPATAYSQLALVAMRRCRVETDNA